MGFEFVLTKQAEQDLKALDRQTAKRIVKKSLWFNAQTNPLLHAKSLREPAIGDVRLRVGDYRLIAIINHKYKRIEIVKIGHRREIYL